MYTHDDLFHISYFPPTYVVVMVTEGEADEQWLQMVGLEKILTQINCKFASYYL